MFLRRSIGFGALVAYGIGDILGAGIYALVGKVAGLVGSACWLSFLISFVVASLTGLSYAELASRHPHAAGEVVFSLAAFRRPLVSYLIGFLVFLSGVVSMATVSHGFSGYVRNLFPGIPSFLIILLLLSALGVINFLGMKTSSRFNIGCTLVEVSGILIVIAAGLKYFGTVPYFSITPPEGVNPARAVFQGGLLAFYAFIGFEDMVKAAEETYEPRRIVPKAIVTALMVTAGLYVLTALACVSAVPISELASSSAPLMLVVEKGFPVLPRGWFALIALFAVSNTALVNFIMSSRMLYGMAQEGLVPSGFGRVHVGRRTPHLAIGMVFVTALLLAFTGSLVVLAQSTSLLLLSVFLVMNLALITLKFRSTEPRPSFEVPIWVPFAGAGCSLGFMVTMEPQAFRTVFALILVGVALYIFQKLRR